MKIFILHTHTAHTCTNQNLFGVNTYTYAPINIKVCFFLEPGEPDIIQRIHYYLRISYAYRNEKRHHSSKNNFRIREFESKPFYRSNLMETRIFICAIENISIHPSIYLCARFLSSFSCLVLFLLLHLLLLV